MTSVEKVPQPLPADFGDASFSGAVFQAIVQDIEALVVFIELPSGQVTTVHGAGMLGFRPEEVSLVRPMDLLVFEDRSRVQALAETLFRDQIPVGSIEVVIQDALGALRPVCITLRTVETPERHGLLVSIVDLRREHADEETRKRRQALNAVVERASHRLALAPHDLLDTALSVTAEELAAVVHATTMSFWMVGEQKAILRSPWVWPSELATLASTMNGASVDELCDLLAQTNGAPLVVRSMDLTDHSPRYLQWLRARGGSLVCLARPDNNGNTRILSYHVEAADLDLDPDLLHAVRNAFEIIGNAIDRRLLARTIEDTARWSQAVLESSSDMLGVLSADSTIRYASASVRDLGYERADLEGRKSLEMVHPDDVASALELFTSDAPRVVRFLTADGTWRHLECRVRNLLDDPTIGGLLLNARDVTERVNFERTVNSYSEAQRLLATVTGRLSAALPGQLLDELRSGLVDIVTFTGFDRGGLWWANDGGAVEAAMFVSSDGSDLLPKNILKIVVPENLPPLTFERMSDSEHPVLTALFHPGLPPLGALMAAPFTGPTGQIGMLSLAATSPEFNPDETVRQVVSAFAQIVTTAMLRHDAESRLQRQANIDTVTGLANRAVMRRRLEEDLARAKGLDETVALLLLDLDDFKLVNDGYGHLAGDDLLRQFGERLRSICNLGDLVARLGGDEFVVMRSGQLGADEIDELAEKIHATLRVPFVIDDREFTVSASVGISLFVPGADAMESADLLRRADIAMYRSKQRGPGETERFDEGMGQKARGDAVIRSELETAIKTGALDVWFQPIIDLVSGRRIGAEALVRWPHHDRGMIAPDVFIPIAERAGLICALGELVLRRATAALGRLSRLGAVDEMFYVSVNVAAPQLQEIRFVDMVAEALSDAGLVPAQVRFEITESRLVDRSLLGLMQKIQRSGIQLAIDDFGTGYSSLASLQDLPVDVLKIDRSFVQRIDTDRQAAALVAAVVTMANTLGLQTVAEGVETEGQRAVLQSFACPAAQGFLFARPMPEAQWIDQSLFIGRDQLVPAIPR